MEKSSVFISHITEESDLATILKTHIANDFLLLVDVFVSSENSSILVGDRWLDMVDHALHKAEIMLILCSQASIKRPWINFEAGAAWIKKIPVIPICHTDMNVSNLPVPLNLFQATTINEKGLQDLYTLLAKKLGSSTPKGNFTQIVSEAESFESNYGRGDLIRNAINSLFEISPYFKEMLLNPHPIYVFNGDIETYIFDKMRDHLEILKIQNLLNFSIQGERVIGDAFGNVKNSYSVHFVLDPAIHHHYSSKKPN